MYTYVFTIRRRCRRKEKDELLAHMQAHRSARTLHQRHRQKKQLQLAQKKEKELFSLVACIYVYVYMCNDVIVTSMPCLLQLFASEQINVFLLSVSVYIYIYAKRTEMVSVTTSQD